MDILQSWKQSLSIFAPANFTQFVRDVIKTTFETYTILCTQWRSIAVLLIYMAWRYIDVGIFLPYAVSGQPGGRGVWIWYAFQISFLVTAVLFNMFVVLIFVAARSSRTIKNNAYFQRYFWYFVPLISVAVVLSAIEWDIPVRFFRHTRWVFTYTVPFPFILRIAEPTLLLMSVFFFLDSNGTWYQLCRSVVLAAKMVLYNMPLFALLTVLVLFIESFCPYNVGGRIGMIFIMPLLWFIMYSLIIALGATLYTKIRHAQPELYID